MRPSLAAEALRKLIQIRRPGFIWGPPGVGKSAIVKQVASSLGLEVVDLRLSLLDNVDLRGFPHMVDKRMHFATPAFLPTDPNSKGVLFLDEMNAAPQAVQAAAYQLVLDRRSGEYILPDGWALIAAGNRETDQGVVYTMPAPLANRFVHLDYEVNFDDWRKWASNYGIRTEITSFLDFRPGLLNDFDPDKRAFPTPRSWQFVSEILDSQMTPEVEKALIAGAVGDGAKAELISFLKVYRTLPKPELCITSPKTAPVPTDLATIYALCGALSERADSKTFPGIIEYVQRLKPEFQVLCIRDAVGRNKELLNTAEFGTWAQQHAEVFI